MGRRLVSFRSTSGTRNYLKWAQMSSDGYAILLACGSAVLQARPFLTAGEERECGPLPNKGEIMAEVPTVYPTSGGSTTTPPSSREWMGIHDRF